MKKTVCVDLDATLATYDKWVGLDHIGDPLPGAVDFTKRLSEFSDVVIYTTRCSVEMGRGLGAGMLKKIVQDWLDKHGFAYADIWVGQGKPIFAALIDDRAVACRPQEDALAFESALLSAQRLCGV